MALNAQDCIRSPFPMSYRDNIAVLRLLHLSFYQSVMKKYTTYTYYAFNLDNYDKTSRLRLIPHSHRITLISYALSRSYTHPFRFNRIHRRLRAKCTSPPKKGGQYPDKRFTAEPDSKIL
jgi:hypothetical protein